MGASFSLMKEVTNRKYKINHVVLEWNLLHPFELSFSRHVDKCRNKHTWVIISVMPYHPEYCGVYFLHTRTFSYIIPSRKTGFPSGCILVCRHCHHSSAALWLELALGQDQEREKRREQTEIFPKSSGWQDRNSFQAGSQKTGFSQKFNCQHSSLIWSALGWKLRHKEVRGWATHCYLISSSSWLTFLLNPPATVCISVLR